MSKVILVLGQKELKASEEEERKKIRRTLYSLGTKRIVTDYSEGWPSLVLDEVFKVGVPFMGVLPYPSENPDYKKLSQRAQSNIIFNKTKLEFLSNPFSYFTWVNSYTTEALIYFSQDTDSIHKRTLRALKNKIIRNMY